MAGRQRLDSLVVERGLALTIDKARALIMAGQVIVDDHTVDKAGHLVVCAGNIRLKNEPSRYVSRGGLKLRRALDEFGVDVTGLTVVDVGSSTGGFTDCLLQAGAAKVFAIDVGYGQLAWKLQQDSRVVSMEKTNIRYVTPDQIAGKPELAVVDASFISLGRILPAIVALLPPRGKIIALVKPQFEVDKGEVGKGGIVRDPAAHEKVIEDVRQAASGLGLTVPALCESPITGADGNREFLMLLQLPDNPGREG